jgi:hypothetical protein
VVAAKCQYEKVCVRVLGHVGGGSQACTGVMERSTTALRHGKRIESRHADGGA